MGQKTHPYGFRLGITKPWRSRWFAKRDYSRLLHEDLKLKRDLKKQLAHAGVSNIEVERMANKLRITIYTSRPGIIIGRKGAEIDKLKADIQKRTNREVYINIQEIHRPELDAQLVGESIALQLEKRIAFRRAMRKSVDSALRFGAKGIKVRVSGRLNGAEIARSEWYLQGQLPLHTLRADIDYGFSEARTTYGVIGVKAWLYKGEIMDRQIEAARVAMTRFIKRGGKVWIRFFPDKPITKKPAETRMGKGKGAPEQWVAVIRPGKVLFEMEGVDAITAKQAMSLAADKLPIRTKLVSRATVE